MQPTKVKPSGLEQLSFWAGLSTIDPIWSSLDWKIEFLKKCAQFLKSWEDSKKPIYPRYIPGSATCMPGTRRLCVLSARSQRLQLHPAWTCNQTPLRDGLVGSDNCPVQTITFQWGKSLKVTGKLGLCLFWNFPFEHFSQRDRWRNPAGWVTFVWWQFGWLNNRCTAVSPVSLCKQCYYNFLCQWLPCQISCKSYKDVSTAELIWSRLKLWSHWTLTTSWITQGHFSTKDIRHPSRGPYTHLDHSLRIHGNVWIISASSETAATS